MRRVTETAAAFGVACAILAAAVGWWTWPLPLVVVGLLLRQFGLR